MSQYLDYTGLQELVTKTKEYTDNKTAMDKIWTNPDTTGSWSGGQISVSTAWNNYKFLFIQLKEWAPNGAELSMPTAVIPVKNLSTKLVSPKNTSYHREMSFGNNYTDITFGNGKDASNNDTPQICYPTGIYGVK